MKMTHRQLYRKRENKTIIVGISDHIATITLNRPSRGNALTSQMNAEVISAFRALEADSSVRVIVLTGAGKHFCTGMELQVAGDHEDPVAQVEKGFEVFRVVKRCRKPVVARVNGPALGGGVGLMFCADVRVMVADAYLAFVEVKRGLVPAIISQFIVPELGMFRANQYMLTGERISAEQALRGNFITAVTDGGAPLDLKVQEYTSMLLSSAPGAMATIKDLVGVVGSTASEKDKNEKIKEVFLAMMQSEEAAYGIRAFMQKEAPDWTKFCDAKSKL